MRTVDQPEPFGGLGPKVEKPEMPKPHKRINGDVWQKPDGRFENIAPPPPPPTAPTIYDFYNIPPPCFAKDD